MKDLFYTLKSVKLYDITKLFNYFIRLKLKDLTIAETVEGVLTIHADYIYDYD